MNLNSHLSHAGYLNLRRLLTFLQPQLSLYQIGIVLATLRVSNSYSVKTYAKWIVWAET